MAPPPRPLRQYAAAPPMGARPVTEDTPPDLLEGELDLQVTLPSGTIIKMSVDRSTPMMDLLVQITTTHKINPGNHVIRVLSDNIYLTYKPSTPVGNLDTSAIEIVPKNKVNVASIMEKSYQRQQSQEQNLRLKVNLPRNQLAVYRIPPKTLISDILSMVCEDKNLEMDSHEIRHPLNIDERLRGSSSLQDYQLQEVCIVSRDFRPSPLSVTDLITMASMAHHQEDRKRRGLRAFFSRKPKSSTGDSSVSSGSAGDRSISPARSDESVENAPSSSTATFTDASQGKHRRLRDKRLPRPSSLLSLVKGRKRQAPPPPPYNGNHHASNGNIIGVNVKKPSSGYREQPDSKSSHYSSQVSRMEQQKPLSLSESNLTTALSVSNSTIVSSRGKRKAPPPPKLQENNQSSILEETEPKEGSMPKETEPNEGSMPKEFLKELRRLDTDLEEELSNINKDLEIDSLNEDYSENKSSKLSDSSKFENMKNLSYENEECDNSQVENKPPDKNENEENPPERKPDFIELPAESPDTTESKLPVESSAQVPSIESVESSDPNWSKDPSLESSDPRVVSPHSLESPDPLLVSNSLESSNPQVVSPSQSESSQISSLSSDPRQTPLPKSSQAEIEDKVDVPPTYVDSVEKSLDASVNLLANDPVYSSTDKEPAPVSSSETGRTSYELDVTDIGHSESPQLENFAPQIPRSDYSSDSIDTWSHERVDSGNSSQESSPVEAISTEMMAATPDRLTEAINEVLDMGGESVVIDQSLKDKSSSDHSSHRRQEGISLTAIEISPLNGNFHLNEEGSDSANVISRNYIEDDVSDPEESEPSQTSIKQSLTEDIKSTVQPSVEYPKENVSEREKEWDDLTISNYNVVLAMKPQSQPRPKNTDRYSSNTDSSGSYQSLRNSPIVNIPMDMKTSRSSTETSYESAPPPVPETSIPEVSDTEDTRSIFSTVSSISIERRHGSLSRQSSISDVSYRGHDDFTQPKIAAFSISTYQTRAQEVSYDKKLTRSESFQEISRPRQIEELELRRPGLNRNESFRTEIYRTEPILSYESKSRSLDRSASTSGESARTTKVDEIKAKIEKNVGGSNDGFKRPWTPSDFRSGKYEPKPAAPPRRIKEHQKYGLNQDKSVTSSVANKEFYLRKAKSTADIRVSEGQQAQGIPDPGLTEEYMKLQDDFMKWQQQLLQNQNLLHNRVAPIAANPPTLSNVGPSTGLKLGWKTSQPWLMRDMMMQPPAQPNFPSQTEPRKPREINIPIRLEEDVEEQSNSSMTQSITVNQRNEAPGVGAQPSLNDWNTPNMTMGAWQDRPSNVECVIVNEPPQIFQAPTDPTFSPIFYTKERSPTQSYGAPRQVDPAPSFQSRAPQANFQPQSNFASQPGFMDAPQTYYQPPVQDPAFQVNVQPGFTTSAPQYNFQQPQMPQPTYQEVPQSMMQPAPSNFQTQIRQEPYYEQSVPQPNQTYRAAPPQNFGRPQMSYANGLTSTAAEANRNDDNINARFTSVVTLSNDKPGGHNVPPKDKVRSIVQLNNLDNQPRMASQPGPSATINQNYKQTEVQKPDQGFHSKIISNAIKNQGSQPNSLSSERPEAHTPVTVNSSSIAPMSSRLVQAVQQPPPAPIENKFEPVARISPPRREKKKSPSPVAHEPSPPRAFANVSLRPVEQRISPPKASPPQTYSAPPQTYSAPPQTYAAPTQTYAATPQTYAATPQTYAAPPQTYAAPPQTVAAAPQTYAAPPEVQSGGPAGPPPPPPPPCAPAPPPPPPPDRRTSTGKKIISSNVAPDLDARAELMMAIRKFGDKKGIRQTDARELTE